MPRTKAESGRCRSTWMSASGESRLTWQVVGGISYAYAWGELSAMWRYLAYDMKSGGAVKDLDFSGPMLGATFRW